MPQAPRRSRKLIKKGKQATEKTGGKAKKPPVLDYKKGINVRKIKIKLIAVGGGAASIVSEMARSLNKVNYLLADTDQRSFRKQNKRLVKPFEFGKEKTYGWGTGMNPAVAREAIVKEKEKIKKAIEGYDFVILLSCLGGGVGSGVSPVFAEIIKESKILSLGIFTLPFSFEGKKKAKIADESLKELRELLSSVIVLPNEKIINYADKKEPLKKSLSLMNKFLIDYLKDIVGLVSQTGLINIDFADIKAVLSGTGQDCCFGRSVTSGPNREEKIIEELFRAPFFSCPPKLDKILFNISNGGNLELKEVEKIARAIANLNERAKIIFGISQDSSLAKKIKLTFLGVGRNNEEGEKNRVGKEKSISEKKEKKREREENGKKEKNKKISRKPKNKKVTRKNAIEVEKERKEIEEGNEDFDESTNWEIPAFLRRKDD